MGSSCKALPEPTWAALGPRLLALALRPAGDKSPLQPWGLSASLSLLSSLAGAAPWCCPGHCPSPHPSAPARALSTEGGTGSALPGAGAQALALCIPETHPALLSIRDTFPLLVPPCHHCLQCSALTGTWGHFLSPVPQWDPLKLQETSELDCDFEFLRGFFISLSGSDVQGLSTKPREGHCSPCAVSVLLGWAGLLAQRQLLASGSAAERQLWPGAAPGHSPAGLGHCLQPARAQHRGTESFSQSGLGRC